MDRHPNAHPSLIIIVELQSGGDWPELSFVAHKYVFP